MSKGRSLTVQIPRPSLSVHNSFLERSSSDIIEKKFLFKVKNIFRSVLCVFVAAVGMLAYSSSLWVSENILKCWLSPVWDKPLLLAAASVRLWSVSLWNFVSDSQLPEGVLAFTEVLYQVWLYMGPGDLNSSLPISIASVCPPSHLPRPKFLIFIKWLWLKLLVWGN